MPVTIPLLAPIVATAGVPLTHVPKAGEPVNVTDEPTQVMNGPVSTGNGLTVTNAITKQPAGDVYVTVAMPPDMPVKTPVPEIVPTVSGLQLQEPPVGVAESVVLPPTHTTIVPVIGPGLGLTITVMLTEQPVGNVYTMVAVPGETPVMMPDDDPTVATPLLLLVHMPPAGLPVSDNVAPTQRRAIAPEEIPKIVGNGFTVTLAVMKQPVDNA